MLSCKMKPEESLKLNDFIWTPLWKQITLIILILEATEYLNMKFEIEPLCNKKWEGHMTFTDFANLKLYFILMEII